MMTDPVIASDGHSYERAAITEWISRNQTSPKTNQRLANANLIPNHTLKAAIQSWKSQARRAPEQKVHRSNKASVFKPKGKPAAAKRSLASKPRMASKLTAPEPRMTRSRTKQSRA
eukprot:TRINITY_DN29128_c0_g1_i2.p1 TRINITY_DN29128_c0_g1~~TRINITY_DN29128_c0_g1_i2.p1  ORF type:complete len:116 (+),score=27.40 TRINITY_DN29128_c0_g1_i2:166-513(+)